MVSNKVKIAAFLSILCLSSLIRGLCWSASSTSKDRCYGEDEFDSYNLEVSANPTNDGIVGSYDPLEGGQAATWHDSGLMSNGEEFVIAVSGAWLPWGSDVGAGINTIQSKPRCNFCAKRSWNEAPNCVCYSDQTPEPEFGKENCSADFYDDPNICTCTNKAEYGIPTDLGFYHTNLNYYEKNGSTKIADKQEVCKYDRGMGLYIGLFGSKGVDTPKRIYHLFAPDEMICPVGLVDGKCLDDKGVDVMRYIYRSQNNLIFMKDDGAKNDGSDTNTVDDIYHKQNEVVKFVIADDYYSDNAGHYNISIWKGVGYAPDKNNKKGILEYIVSFVEDIFLGELDSEGVRKNGVIEFFYKSIVLDSFFITSLHLMLALYICFYGMATLAGVAEIKKSELMNRVLKIGLILFFTSPDSWQYYNQIIVGFFYDSSNYLISLFTSLSTSVPGVEKTPQLVQATTDSSGSIVTNSTRFGYIDTVISSMFSESASAKIISLLFSELLGAVYLIIIYIIIAGFLLVMTQAMLIYIINMMKVVFLLSLGPIFLCFSLFSNTSGYFKNWIGYLSARALEIVVLFFVVYMFVVMINGQFNSLLYYKACAQPLKIGGMTVLSVLYADVKRSTLEWFSRFASIAALIFMMKLIFDKIPEIAGGLISINDKKGHLGSDPNKGYTGGLAEQSGKILSDALQNVKKLLNKASVPALIAANSAASAAMSVARATGVAGAISKVTDMIPINNPRAMYRNSIIDAEIAAARKSASAAGKTGKDFDKQVRSLTMAALNKKMASQGFADMMNFDSDKKTGLIAGMDDKQIEKRLDQKLIHEPLQKAIKDEIQRIKASDKPLFGEDLRNAAISHAKDWANKNLYIGADDVNRYLAEKSDAQRDKFDKKLQSFINSNVQYSSQEAAKAALDNQDFRNKYISHLANEQLKIDQRRMGARSGINASAGKDAGILKQIATGARNAAGIIPAAGNAALDAMRVSSRIESLNPNLAAKNFARHLDNLEKDKFKTNPESFSDLASGTLQSLNPVNYSSTLTSASQVIKGMTNKQTPHIFANTKSDINDAIRQYLRTEPTKRSNVSALSAKENALLNKKHDQQEAKKREVAQRKLTEVARGDRELNNKIKEIRALQSRGKDYEAKDAKAKLLSQLMADLVEKDASGKAKFKAGNETIHERLAKIEHAQKQLGIDGFEAKKSLSDLVKSKFEDSEKRFSETITDKNYLFSQSARDELESGLKDLKALSSGMLFEDPAKFSNSKAASEIAEKLLNDSEKAIRNFKNEEPKEIDIKKLEESRQEYQNNSELDRKNNEQEAIAKTKMRNIEELFEKAQKEIAAKEEELRLQEVQKKKDEEAAKINMQQLLKTQEIVGDFGKMKEGIEELKKLKADNSSEVLKKSEELIKDFDPMLSLENAAKAKEALKDEGVNIEDLQKKFAQALKDLEEEKVKIAEMAKAEEEKARKELESRANPVIDIDEQAKFKGSFDQIYEHLSDSAKTAELMNNYDDRIKIVADMAQDLDLFLQDLREGRASDDLEAKKQQEMAIERIGSLAKDLEAVAIFNDQNLANEIMEGKKIGAEELQSRMDDLVKKSEEVAQNLGIAKDSLVPLIPTSFEVQFGGSILDVLLQAPTDFGLKAGNPFLGIPEEDGKKVVSESVKVELKQNELKQKIKEIDKKVKNFELEKAKQENDLAKISALEKDLKAIDRDLRLIENDSTELRSELL